MEAIQDIEVLYTIYVNARARAWNRYDALADKDLADTDELYRQSLRAERRAWNAYLAARKAVGDRDE